ncbi:MAG: hypothetical protein ACOYYS_01005 [Chloroflexota bacterium]
MSAQFPLGLQPLLAPGASAERPDVGRYRLTVPASPHNGRPPYVVAQLDDYHNRARRAFPWRPPCTLALRARIFAGNLPGTWGFGFWNDPFSFSLGLGGASRRFPALPNAAWFFYGSPPNYLSFRDDLPAQGFLAATFRAPKLPAPLLALASPGLILGALPVTARLLRRVLRGLIAQDACLIPPVVLSDWHHYRLNWEAGGVTFALDGNEIFTTPVVPCAPLALVLWIDNQFAAFPPGGRIAFGSLPLPTPAYLELADIQIS